LPTDELLHDFGVFTAEKTFVGLYPALFALSGSSRSFLLTVERPIHELVRTVMREASPPRLSVSESADNGISIVYTSQRRMCSLLRGLVQGTARHYGETVHIDEPTCMHRGDEACTFELSFAGA
jgi:hypothetical protein